MAPLNQHRENPYIASSVLGKSAKRFTGPMPILGPKKEKAPPKHVLNALQGPIGLDARIPQDTRIPHIEESPYQ